jgi:tetratricopeptide (TPR) repeat protein
LSSNFPTVSRFLNIDISDTTANTRLWAWEAAFEGWKEKSIFGWGAENFQDLFDNHYNPRFLEVSFEETVWDKPHNFPLEVLGTIGVIGFIAYLSIIGLFYYYLIQIYQKEENKTKRNAFLILGGAMAAYIGQSLFSIEAINSQLFFFGILAMVSYFYTNNTDQKQKNFFQKGVIQKGMAFIFIVILVFVPYFLYKNYSMYKSSILMSQARDATDYIKAFPSEESLGLLNVWQENALATLAYPVPFSWEQALYLTKDLIDLDGFGIIDKAILDKVSPKIIENFEYEIRKNNYSFSNRLWLSQLYFLLAQYCDISFLEKSNKLLLEAKEISPKHQQVPIHLAKNYILQNRISEAIGLLRQLKEDNPNLAEPHWFLGILLYENGQEEEGLKELELGYNYGSRNIGNIKFLIDIYAKIKEYDKIIPLYIELTERDSGNASYFASLAAVYAEKGDKENMFIYLNKAVELNPGLKEEARLFLEQQGMGVNLPTQSGN